MLIEINLAPGASAGKLRARSLPTISLPSLPALGGDPRVIGGVAAAILVVGALGFGFLRMGTRTTALEASIRQEAADSARYASTIELIRSLQARQDTIVQKIEVIRGVDGRRYVWPHLLDEISLAVPAYTWLTEIRSTAVADSLQTGPGFTVQGNAGSTQALTRFMKNLEASAFIAGVTLITSEQETVEGRTIQRFSLEARYQTPPASEVAMVPFIVVE